MQLIEQVKVILYKQLKINIPQIKENYFWNKNV